MIAGAPRYGALFGSALLLRGLTFNTDLHKMIPANGTVVNLALPLPHCHCVPLFDYELILFRRVYLHVRVHFFHKIDYYLLNYNKYLWMITQ